MKDDKTSYIFALFSTISRTCSKSPFFIPQTSSLIFVTDYRQIPPTEHTASPMSTFILISSRSYSRPLNLVKLRIFQEQFFRAANIYNSKTKPLRYVYATNIKDHATRLNSSLQILPVKRPMFKFRVIIKL